MLRCAGYTVKLMLSLSVCRHKSPSSKSVRRQKWNSPKDIHEVSQNKQTLSNGKRRRHLVYSHPSISWNLPYNWWKYENCYFRSINNGTNPRYPSRVSDLPIIGSLAATHQRLTSLSSNQNFIGHSPIDSTRAGHVQCGHRCLYLQSWPCSWLSNWEQFNLQFQRGISTLVFEDDGPSLHDIITDHNSITLEQF